MKDVPASGIPTSTANLPDRWLVMRRALKLQRMNLDRFMTPISMLSCGCIDTLARQPGIVPSL